MKTRIISAAVGIVLLLAVLLCPYTVVLAVLLAAIAALAVWELLHATGRVKEPLLLYGSMAFAAARGAGPVCGAGDGRTVSSGGPDGVFALPCSGGAAAAAGVAVRGLSGAGAAASPHRAPMSPRWGTPLF